MICLGIPWNLWVHTSNMKGADAKAKVKLILYGDKGKSDEIDLRTETGIFQAGYCDEFKTDITDVGIPFKLRVSLGKKKLSAAWHLDRV